MNFVDAFVRQIRPASKSLFIGIVGTALTATAVHAESVPWQKGFQDPVTPVMERIHDFHTLLLWIISLISLFVLGLLVYCMLRFNEKKNPVPSKTSHNTLVEVLWTVIPIMILIVIAIPSFRLLYFSDRTPDADMTLKAIGYQWYWGYEYPDHGNFTFDAIMLEEDELADGQPRLLATDNAVVVPTNKNIRLLVTADDVLHSWAMPQFGVKLDGVPGRLNETWFRVEKPGIYYGQCSELCGARHGFMPIMVKAVAEEEFNAWVEQAKEEFARADGPAVNVAEITQPNND